MKPLVPRYVYSGRVLDEDIPFFEKMFYDDVKFYPDSVKETEKRFEFAKRVGYGYMMHELPKHVDNSFEDKLVTIGDKGFEWKYLPDLFNRSGSGVFICAGAGTNISFERELARRYPRSKVVLLDPTPQSINYVRSQPLEPNLTFVEKGLSKENGVLTFYRPSIKGIGSLSALKLNPGDEKIELPVTNVATLIGELGVAKEAVDYLKFDIEGSEHDVIEHIVEADILPAQVTFEFDQPVPPWTIERTLKKLLSRNYKIASVWGLNVLMIREDV